MNQATIRLSQKLPEIAKDLSAAIEEAAGERIGFTLLVFTAGRASYISSINREDSVRELKKLLEYWEKGMPDVSAHEYSS